ncbi:MAG TPA: hypothetical protein VFM32_00810 [Spongiibacteraceae bacterium]|nr:hypothetical protein [Spongiibacteraceae bacterium]
MMLTACGDNSSSTFAKKPDTTTPAAPAPEPVAIEELPLPPTSPSDTDGSCTTAINTRGTGCMSASPGAIQSGSFLPDGHHVVALVQYTGAPAAPDPASVYSGAQLIIVKTDGTTFANGDAWKCITCGMPAGNALGINGTRDYPQTFHDGKRLLAGSNIFDCSPHLLTDDDCTPDQMHAYPIRWNVTADGSGNGGSIRELRLHPDDTHLGFNAVFIGGGKYDEYGYFSRLVFNPAPTTGTPLVPRYDLSNVTLLFQDGLDKRVLSVSAKNPKELVVNQNAIEVGEFRGFTKDGREVMYVGYPFESSNIDIFSADLTTGAVRRLTGNPEYTDPVDSSPDDKWIVAMDTRGSDRQMFLAGMRWIPPITDAVTTSATSSTRNNGARRFFQPILIDRYGDRGDYQGQQLNAGDGSPGSASDPNWNGMADPRWSPDGTSVVYWQALVTSPACGGANPLPCPDSTEPGGRRTRMMLARLTSRTPLSIAQPAVASDTVPWGTPYVPGSAAPQRAHVPAGSYVLNGKVSGTADVQITETADQSAIATVSVDYKNYADVAGYIINGSESVTGTRPSITKTSIDWYSSLVQSGSVSATKTTSADGFHLIIDVLTNLFNATGTLTTTIDGKLYTQPANGT